MVVAGREGKSHLEGGMVYVLFSFCGAFIILVKIFLNQSIGRFSFYYSTWHFLLYAELLRPLIIAQ